MNLKPNDKIILIVGVVILIVAGVGIALYSSPSDETPTDTDFFDETYFEYTWIEKRGSETIESPFVEKTSSLERTYSIKGPAGSVLTQVTMMIEWEDDHTYGVFRTKGGDTLTAEVSIGGKSREEISELEGNLSFPFNINQMPVDDKIMATSESEAASKLSEDYKNKNTAQFDILLGIEIGEPWWRPFQRWRDKGNSVDISVEYTYYVTELTEVEEDDLKKTGSDDNDDVIVSGFGIGDFYVNLGYGRGMI
jgi:hypothetical protein